MTSLPLLLILVLFITNLKPCETTTTRPFICGAGVCNLNNGDEQYCSQGTDPRCVLCRDVGYSCFKPNMPYNCTKYCLEQHCKPLPNITNGFHNALVLVSPGDIALMWCKKGYHLNGNGNMSCLQYGYWSDPIPTCEKDSTDSSFSRLEKGLIGALAIISAYALIGTVIAICIKKIRNKGNKYTTAVEDPNPHDNKSSIA